ncbi:GlcG/HbpS family heme-binding protein [Algicella marina]|uniref:Heme-binding protein n=1 Tax=Algicella marina TaxID=2683284 RepID=A0A6P1SWH0_9RHOB|nr:heme-binding protein [Algicella marina]QHQ34107.1 heme-binding protein [Algicella marina]
MAYIPLRKARTMIRSVFRRQEQMSLKPLSVVLLDPGGHPIAFERQDGAAPGRFEIARAKAYGAVMLGIGGEAQYARAESQPYFALAANGAFDGKLVPVPGGILIRTGKGTVLGAMGVSGDTSENDSLCGVAAIEDAGFVAEP